ncbi:MAG: hypothetical protein AAFN80_10725 [Pseudomonadota bacterium]
MKDTVSDNMRMVIVVIFIFVLCCLLAYQSLIAWDVRNVRDSQRAYVNFIFDAATLDCVRRTSIIQTAEARGWQIEDDRQPPFRSWSPDNWTKAVRVFIKPQLNFAKEPGVMFFFDDEDCLIGDE